MPTLNGLVTLLLVFLMCSARMWLNAKINTEQQYQVMSTVDASVSLVKEFYCPNLSPEEKIGIAMENAR